MPKVECYTCSRCGKLGAWPVTYAGQVLFASEADKIPVDLCEKCIRRAITPTKPREVAAKK